MVPLCRLGGKIELERANLLAFPGAEDRTNDCQTGSRWDTADGFGINPASWPPLRGDGELAG